jgi:hypothetical protein
MKSVLQIIKEEISNFYSDWQIGDNSSMADKYYEKNLGISTKKPQESKIDAELIGYVTKLVNTPLKKPISIYKNPKNLNDFENDARGVLLNNGDLYLATSRSALHDNMLDLLTEKGIIPYQSKFDYSIKYPEQFVAVQRALNSTTFAQSSAYNTFPLYYEEIFDIANKKQPYHFKELPMHEGDEY